MCLNSLQTLDRIPVFMELKREHNLELSSDNRDGEDWIYEYVM